MTCPRPPDGHERRRQAAQERPKDSAHGAIQEPKLEQHRAIEPDDEVVARDVGAEPQQGDLHVAGDRWGLALVGRHAGDPAGLKGG